MMYKQVLAALAFGLCVATPLWAQKDTVSLTFPQAITLMYENNPALEAARQEVKEKEYEHQVKRGLYMPHVSLNAQAVSMSDPLHLDLTDVRDAISPLYGALGNYGVFNGVPYTNPETGEVIAILDQQQSTAAVRQQMLDGQAKVMHGEWDQVIQEKNFAAASAGVSWPIFAGGKIRGANQAAKTDIELAREELVNKKGELMNELVTRYYGLVLASQVRDVMYEKLAAMQSHYDNASKKFDEGMLAKLELLNASVALSEASREYTTALRRVETVQNSLFATLAVEADTCYLTIDKLFVNEAIPELPYWTTTALANNSMLKQIEHKKELVDIKERVNKGDYLPTVALMGNYNLADYQLSPYMPEWLVGVGMKWTVFDGMARNSQTKADKALKQKVVSLEQNAHDNIETYVNKLYNDVCNYKYEIDELQHTVELAQEYFESTEKAFREGLANSSDVVNAQSKLSQARALQLKSYYDYDVTLMNLMYICGVPEDILQYSHGPQARIQSIEKK